jgi:tetratricopeptide (TPR) repeat protein
MNDGRFDDAIAILELNLESNPYDARSFLRLGDAYLGADDVTTAIEYFREALSMNSSNTYATNMLQRLETRN